MKPNSERRHKQWWAILEGGNVQQVEGVESMGGRNCWFIPQTAVVLREGEHLFTTKQEAYAKAIAALQEQVGNLLDRIRKLEKERGEG